jgi:polyisoprenoid-binding protein YceI
MRRTGILALVASSALSFPTVAWSSTWEIDPAHTSIEFGVKHMMVSTVKGSFAKVKGTLELDEKDLSKSMVEVEVDMASVNTHDPKRDGHLKSPDFFDVAKYPTATFKSTKVQKAGKNKLKVHGDLTLHGVTKPIVLDVEGPTAPLKTPFGSTVRGVHATTKLDRKDFGIVWNKALDSGGVLVGNEVKLDLNIELSEKPPATVKPAQGTAQDKPGGAKSK